MSLNIPCLGSNSGQRDDCKSEAMLFKSLVHDKTAKHISNVSSPLFMHVTSMGCIITEHSRLMHRKRCVAIIHFPASYDAVS